MNKTVQDLLNNLPAGVKIEIKDGWFWKFIGWLAYIISFGQNKTFNTTYATTMFNTIALPVSMWDMRETEPISFYEIIKHELTHIEQFKRLGFGNVYLGSIVQGFLYVFIPLPMGFAKFRYKFESEAYINSFRAICQWIKENPDSGSYDIDLIRSKMIYSTYVHMTTGDYGFAMNFCKQWVNDDLMKRFNQVKYEDI